MSDAAETKVPSRRRWPRILRRTAWIVLGLVLVVRIALPIVIPSVIESSVAGFGLTTRYDDLEMSFLDGSVTLRRFELGAAAEPTEDSTEAPVAEPYGQLDYLFLDLDLSALWTGTLRVNRVEVDGLTLHVERNEDGTLPLLEHFASSASTEQPSDDSEPVATTMSEEEPSPPDYRIPVWVDDILAQGLRLHLVDRAVSPPIETWVETSLRIADLGAPDRDARIRADLHGSDLLDRLGIEGSVQSSEEALRAGLALQMEGLRPRAAEPWLAALGITPRAEHITACANLDAGIERSAPDATTSKASVSLREIQLSNDLAEAVALDHFSAEIDGLGGSRLLVPAIEAKGLRGSATRTESGHLLVAGLEFGPAPTLAGAVEAPDPTKDPASPVEAPPATAEWTDSGEAPPTTLALDLLQLTQASVQLRDEWVQPAVDLEVDLQELSLQDLDTGAAADDAEARVLIRAAAPGIAELLEVDGTLSWCSAHRSLDLRVQGQRVTLDRLAAHLEIRGLASELEKGHLDLRVSGRFEDAENGTLLGGLTLAELSFRDRDETLFRLDRIALQDVLLGGPDVLLGKVQVADSELPVRRDEEGQLHFLGLRTLASAEPSNPAAATPATAETTTEAGTEPAGATQRVVLDHFELAGLSLVWSDALLTPVQPPARATLAMTLDDFVLGGDPGRDEADHGTIDLGVAVVGVTERIGLRGTVTSRPGPLDLALDLALEGEKLRPGPLAPYLEALDIETTLQDGDLRGTVTATARSSDAGLQASAALRDFAWGDAGEEPYLSVAAIEVDRVTVGAEGLMLGTVILDEPRVRMRRAADGALHLLGLRLGGEAAADAPNEPTIEAPPQAASVEATPEGSTGTTSTLTLASLQLRNGRLLWIDDALPESLRNDLGLDFELTDLHLGPGANPAQLELRVTGTEAIDSTTLTGQLLTDPTELGADLLLQLRGLRSGPWTHYLPPGMVATMQQGDLDVELSTRLQTTESGTRELSLDLGPVDYRERGASEPWLAWERLRVRVPKMDDDAIQIEELSLTGTELLITAGPEQSTNLLGLRITPPPATADGELPASAEATAATTVESSADKEGASTAKGASPAQESKPREALPVVTLDTLDLQLARLRFVDRSTGQAGEPIDTSLRLFNKGTVQLLDPDKEEEPPIVFELTGAVAPIAESIAATVSAEPWGGQPHFEISLAAEGLHGATLPDHLPALAGELEASALDGGRLGADLELSLDLQRRGPLDVDMSRGFGAEAILRNLAFQARADGPVEAGVQEVYLSAPRIRPDGSVRIARLEVEGIQFRARKSADGLHALGLTLAPAPEPTEPTEPATGSVAAATEIEAPPPQEPAEPIAAAEPAPEIRIDQLSIHGLVLDYVDDSVDPPVSLPLDGLDVQLDGWSSLATSEPVEMRFAASLNGGAVPLPEVHEAGSLISGLLGAAAKATIGGGDEIATEERMFLDEFLVQGRLRLYPELDGKVRTNVAALELGAFRGLARGAGIDIGDGVLNAGMEFEFRGGDVEADGRLAFERLVLDEPPGGPISSFLKLPAPLNSVLFALRDSAGMITVPLSFRVEDAELGGGQITSAALSAFGSVITDAVAAAPLRVSGAVTGTLGIDSLFGSEEDLAEKAVDVPFDPASARLGLPQRSALEPIADLIQDDEVGLLLVHGFGTADYERAARLANPSPEQARALVDRLRQRKAELIRERITLGSDARSLLVTGPVEQAEAAVRRLQGLDRELGSLERSLDKGLALLRPGAERRAKRRARAAAREIGDRRLQAVLEAILELGGEDLRECIEVRPARPNEAIGEGGGLVRVVPRPRT